MSNVKIRKMVTVVEEIRREMGRDIDPPVRKAAAVAVIENPFAGRYEEDLEPLMAAGEHLGGLLGNRCVAALGIEPNEAESYGKAALVGVDGELEHAAALLHPRMGAPLRKAVEKGAALVPRRRSGAGPARRWTYRWATRMRPTSGATSTAWRCRSTTHRARPRSWSRSP